MLVSEEELSVQVAEVDGVEVDYVYFAEAGANEILEQLATYAAGTDHQDSRLEGNQLANGGSCLVN